MGKLSRIMGEKSPELFIMADIGLTNGGDIQRTFELIKIASDLGLDGVKLQMLEADLLLGDREITYSYPTLKYGMQTEVMLEMFKKIEFSDEKWFDIVAEIRRHNMEPIITCHYEGGIERVNKLDLEFNKICTWSLSHHRMIMGLAKNGRPLIIDTGTINEAELLTLASNYRAYHNQEILVLHDFHTEDENEMNFRAMERLKELDFSFGYTPQGRRDWLDFMSIGMGAQVLEKRLTISRDIPENGQWKAHEPDEMANWISNCRECFSALGSKEIKPTLQDQKTKVWAYKSAWLNKQVFKGKKIEETDVDFLRPGSGISSYDFSHFYKGKTYSKDLPKGHMLILTDINV